MKHPEVKVKDIGDYIHWVAKTYGNQDDVLFRGQPARFDLKPKIGRPEFVLRGAKKMPEVERRMLDRFRSHAAFMLDKVPATNMEWLALAQHHGMATRLLDWSTNPLVALWFAVERPAQNQESAAVWAFTAEEPDLIDLTDDPFTIKRTMAFRPSPSTRRIAAQSGWFTVHWWNESARRFVAFETIRRIRERLTKLTIPASSFADIRSHLGRMGIDRSTLFPDIDGLCSNINWLNSQLSDEI